MKTLDEIVNRNDYVRLNEALMDRVFELAQIVLEKMKELDVKYIDEFDLRIVKYSCNAGFSERHLCIVDQNFGEYEYENARSLEVSSSYYYCNDFNAWIQAASSKDRLNFLNNAKSILEYLDALETEKCNDIEEALSETANLVKQG